MKKVLNKLFFIKYLEQHNKSLSISSAVTADVGLSLTEAISERAASSTRGSHVKLAVTVVEYGIEHYNSDLFGSETFQSVTKECWMYYKQFRCIT